VGEPPGTVHGELAEFKPIPVTPLEVAVGVPADALRHRPDVRRAEREVAAQTARIGVATADLYPKFTLKGSIGLEALSLDNLISSRSRTYSIGPRITWAIFDAGAIRQNIEVQSALQEQALIQYEAALLSALEEVENVLVAYANEQVRRQSLVKATQAAERAVDLARKQYASGVIDFQVVLDSERSLLSLQSQLAESDGAVTSNLITLYKVLGGGWTSLGSDDKT
jgi:multidrug efflux system outer membrane protein